MTEIHQKTYTEINSELAKRLVLIRKRQGFTQKELATESGVTYASLRRFEETGEISLQSLTKIAIALKTEDGINNLFCDLPSEKAEEDADANSR